jgi:hypothetical protein
MKTPTKASVKQSATRAKTYATATLDTASKKVIGSVEGFPVAALVGGIAIGAAVGALLPRTKREEQLLGPIGDEINSRALEALGAARDAGKAKLDELGISTDAAGKQVGRIIDSAAQVAEVAGSAAIEAVSKG